MQIIHNYQNLVLSKIVEEIERDTKENEFVVKNIALSSVHLQSGAVNHYAIVIYEKWVETPSER